MLTYGESDNYFPNIGDYIQSIAALQYINDEYITIDRERMDEYDGDEVKLICNGWFMSDSKHWPPSEKIHPLFIAFHITPDAKERILSKKGIGYLKKYEPIGCRDKETMAILQENGIRAYFSACLTLTLNKSYPCYEKREHIYFVDPQIIRPKSLVETIAILKHTLTNIQTISKLIPKIGSNYFAKKNGFLWKLIYTSVFYKQYSSIFSDELLINAKFISHEKELPDATDIQASFEYAHSLLEKYSHAVLVVTSRIHCALPCTSFQTPCLFVDRDGLSQKRFEGLTDFLNVLTLENNRISPSENCIPHLSNLIDGIITPSSKIINRKDQIQYAEELYRITSNYLNNYNTSLK